MKITKSQLKQIIKEELEQMMSEGFGAGFLIGGALVAAGLSGDDSTPEEVIEDTKSDEEKRRIAAELVKKIEQDQGFQELARQWEEADNRQKNKPATNLGWDPSALGEQNIKALLEQELANGNVITENTMKAIAKKFGVPIALVAAIASGIGATDNSADVSYGTWGDTAEMPADAGDMGAGVSDADQQTDAQLSRVRAKMKDLKNQIDQSGDSTGELQAKLKKLDRTETAIMQAAFNKAKF